MYSSEELERFYILYETEKLLSTIATIEMAATYHNIISTVKFHGCSAWDSISSGLFSKKSLTGAGIT